MSGPLRGPPKGREKSGMPRSTRREIRGDTQSTRKKRRRGLFKRSSESDILQFVEIAFGFGRIPRIHGGAETKVVEKNLVECDYSFARALVCAISRPYGNSTCRTRTNRLVL